MMKNDGMTTSDDEQAVLDALRMRGFAVVVFNPLELQEASSQYVEDRLVELGWEVIEDLQ